MNPSAWQETRLPFFAPIDHDLTVDVIVVGGGMTGITTAYLAKKAGLRVALLERDTCAAADTAKTTAHLTTVFDIRFRELAKTYGQDVARAVWDAGQDSIDQIVRNIRQDGIECDFRWLPGFLHPDIEDETDRPREEIDREWEAVSTIGLPAERVDRTPIFGRPGIRFSQQATFHPRKYLAGLLSVIPGNGSHVFEHSPVESAADEPLSVTSHGRRVTGKLLVMATHDPITGISSAARALLLQSRLSLYTSYVIGAKLPQGSVAPGLFWDTADPYHYTRIDQYPEFNYVVFGGEDHKTGQESDTEARYTSLEKKLLKWLPRSAIDYRWCGQVIQSNDGLPLIGEIVKGQFVATAFSGNGITLGTLAARMAVDCAIGRSSPWTDLFDPGRVKIRGGTWSYIRENLDYPYHFLRDRLTSAPKIELAEVKRGEGRIISVDGKKVAAYRDSADKIHLLSPVCTHLRCIVNWNESEKTWDCPCHGARFKPTGEVHAGPAEQPLEKHEA